MSDGWLKLDLSSGKLASLHEDLAAKATRLQEVLYTRVQILTLMLSSKVVANLSNQVLHVRTGVLRGSVNANAITHGSKITGTIQSSAGPAFYGRFHEFGVPHAWEVIATKSRASRFQMSVRENAKAVFSRSVVHPPLPERSFMRSTLDENRAEIIQELRRAVADVLRKNKSEVHVSTARRKLLLLL
jgi:hypothetical protein